MFRRSTRSSRWHLADFKSLKTNAEEDDEYKQETEQLDSWVSDSSPVGGVLEEILELARNVPENMTLGELLGPYVGKIDESLCIEILNSMRDEGLVMGCLYFFEWMGFQEPSLASPQAYSVMFTLLGLAEMGDKLMVLFRNMPVRKEFKDVGVYNSAMSGLSYCGR